MKRLIPALALWLALSVPGLAQEEKALTEVEFSGFTWQPGEVVEINAEKMSIALNEHEATFTGKVVVKKGKSQIYCDTLLVKYLPSGQIDWLKARGSVKMVEGNSFATGDEMEYLHDQNRLRLKGDPKLVNEGQVVTGKLMIFDLNANKLLVDNPRIQFSKAKNEPVNK